MNDGFEGERKTLNALTAALAALPHAHAEIDKVEHPFSGSRTIDAAVEDVFLSRSGLPLKDRDPL